MILTVKDQGKKGAKVVFQHKSGTAKWKLRVGGYALLVKPHSNKNIYSVVWDKTVSGELSVFQLICQAKPWG